MRIQSAWERRIRSKTSVQLSTGHPTSSHSRSLFTRLRKTHLGGTIVEFALACSVFFLLLFMIVDFAAYGFVNLTMQHAVREGARYAITGQSNLDPQGQSDRKRAVIQKIRDSSMGFFDDVMTESDIVVTDSDGNVLTNFGASGQTIVITLNCEWPIVNPFTQAVLNNGKYEFRVGASMRNEAF